MMIVIEEYLDDLKVICSGCEELITSKSQIEIEDFSFSSVNLFKWTCSNCGGRIKIRKKIET